MSGERPLTRKQALFVEAYCGEAAGNATEAARLAGYKGNRRTLAAVGYENLRRSTIAKLLKKTPFKPKKEPPKNDTGSVYLIEAKDVGLFKIGHTCGCPSVRLSTLQTGSPVWLSIIMSTKGSVSDEKFLHAKFSHVRSHGEWFRLSENDVLWVVNEFQKSKTTIVKQAELWGL